jgi:hypothetical protein
VGVEIIGDEAGDVVDSEETEDGEEDSGVSDVGEEIVKEGNCCCLGVSSSGGSSLTRPIGDLPDTLARTDAKVSENARLAFLNLGVADSFPADVNVGLEVVMKTPVLASNV